MVRDDVAAREDLDDTIKRYSLEKMFKGSGRPLLSVLFACGGRGEGLFRENGVDSAAIMAATDEAPCVGFFANGELRCMNHDLHAIDATPDRWRADLLIDLRTGELGPVGARISDGEDRIPTYLHGFTATCGVLVDTGSGGEAGGADEGEA